MKDESATLLSMVRWALGREPVLGDLEDLFMMQRGCYILNSWGVGPLYKYDQFIGGPFSSELAEDYNEMREKGIPWSEPTDGASIVKLRELFTKGRDFTHAYASLIAVRWYNPDITDDEVVEHVRWIEPHLGDNITEASISLGLSVTSTHVA